MARHVISDSVREILSECIIDGNQIRITRLLDRPTYIAVNKVLAGIGGTWNRKAQAHVFQHGDPRSLLDDVLENGHARDLRQETQFFPTPQEIAQRMCDLADLSPGVDVLEPSAGLGHLAHILREHGARVTVIEQHDDYRQQLLEMDVFRVLPERDFLAYKGQHARVVQNPPFSRLQDQDHVRHAYELLKPGGILVSITSPSWQYRQDRKSAAFRAWMDEVGAEVEELPEGSFKESGTNVRSLLLKIQKPAAPPPRHRETRHLPMSEQTSIIKKALLEQGLPVVSVRRDRGTAASWIDVVLEAPEVPRLPVPTLMGDLDTSSPEYRLRQHLRRQVDEVMREHGRGREQDDSMADLNNSNFTVSFQAPREEGESKEVGGAPTEEPRFPETRHLPMPEQTRLIKNALKERGLPVVSVRRGRGTAAMWITVVLEAPKVPRLPDPLGLGDIDDQSPEYRHRQHLERQVEEVMRAHGRGRDLDDSQSDLYRSNFCIDFREPVAVSPGSVSPAGA